MQHSRSATIDHRLTPDFAVNFGRLPAIPLDDDAGEFGALTLRRLRKELASAGPYRIAVGITDGTLPIGLALGECDEHGNARLLSLCVAETHRRRGHGLSLLDAWQREAARRGARRLVFSFMSDATGHGALGTILQRAGWSAPEPLILRVLGRAGVMADIVGRWPAVRDRLSPPSGFQFSPVEPDAADRRAIANLLADPAIGSMRGPLAYSGRLVPETSILLRREGAVVGWVVALPAPRKFVRGRMPAVEYAEFFLEPSLWRSGLGIGAFHHCYRRQAEVFGHASPAYFQTHTGRPAMLALCHRRFAPIADRTEMVLASRRDIDPR
ncbi:GNAT family N-acetyltransferase [Aureimonas sp. SK2]|uniref:GNAT family N-acetyltransferase n=1 Tax=Aureimonas sp. SK2 TaxID=3015992 RepID=UPI002445290E|nr:GNAT family N-acetyltransferase [Aureimonas sp. SK2]